MLALEAIKRIIANNIPGNIFVFVSGMQDMNKLFNNPEITQPARNRVINYHRLHSQIDWDFKAEAASDIRKVVSKKITNLNE